MRPLICFKYLAEHIDFMKKTVFITLVLISLFSTASATLDSNEYSVEYEDSFDITIEDAEGRTTVNTYTIEVCGQNAAGAGGVSVNLPLTKTISIPEDASCGVGKTVIDVTAGDDGQQLDAGTANLEVKPKGGMNAHRGNYLYIIYNTDYNVLNRFFLSNTEPLTGYDPSKAKEEVQIAQYNPISNPLNPFIWDAKELENKPVETSGSFSDYMADPDTLDTEPGKVASQRFVSDNDFTYQQAGEYDTISPVHEDGKYIPEGQIIHGKEPTSYDSSGNKMSKDGRFFICREGAKMDNGFDDEVDQVVAVEATDGATQLYRCENNKWVTVDECDDGLDNDGDGDIDLSDSNCDSSSDTSESDGSCQEFIGINNQGEKVAYYDSGTGTENPLGNSCSYSAEKVTEGAATGPTETFICPISDTDANPQKANFCDAAPDSSFHSSSPKASKYFVPAESIPVSETVIQQLEERNSDYSYTEFQNNLEYKDSNYNVVSNNDWVKDSEDTYNNLRKQCIRMSKGGVVNTECESIHMAEQEYSSDPHSKQTWDNKNLRNTEGYGQTPLDVTNAWISQNAGAENTNVSGSGTINSESTFSGGFAANCGSEQWTYDSSRTEWRCGAPSTNMTVEFFIHTEYKYNRDSIKVGMNIPKESKQKWEQTYGVSTSPQTQKISDVHLKARCWHGKPDDRPNSNDKMVSLSRPLDSPENTIIAGNVPTQDLNNLDSKSYSCNFGFQQAFEDTKDFPAKTVDSLFKADGSTCRNEDGTVQNLPYSFDPCNIVQGSNDNNPIKVKVEQKRFSQTDLETAISNTDNSTNAVFTAFPGAATGADVRNPYEDWQSNYP